MGNRRENFFDRFRTHSPRLNSDPILDQAAKPVSLKMDILRVVVYNGMVATIQGVVAGGLEGNGANHYFVRAAEGLGDFTSIVGSIYILRNHLHIWFFHQNKDSQAPR